MNSKVDYIDYMFYILKNCYSTYSILIIDICHLLEIVQASTRFPMATPHSSIPTFRNI